MNKKSKSNVIPFPKSEKSKATEKPQFAGLASRLDERLNTIENDLRTGLASLENEVAEILASTKSNRSDWQADIESLSKFLESKIQNSLQSVIKDRKNKNDREELNLVASLAGQLAQMLGRDYFKGLMTAVPNDKLKATDDVDAFGVDQNFRLKLKPFFDFLYYKYWRVETTGIENIPNTGRALIVGNHSGALPYDGAMLGITILNEHPVRDDARFLVEDFVYYMPFLGSYMYRLGGIRACPENAQRILETGNLLVVFPEGVKGLGKYYKDRYKLQRFGRGGFIRLCIQTQSPLIPVGIVGAEEIHPIIYKSNSLAKMLGVPYLPITPTFPLMGLLGMLPLPSKWAIHFGKPLDFKKYDLSILDDGITIHKLSEEVRGTIQNILYDQLKNRQSVWGG